jgi:hypothetical protein
VEEDPVPGGDFDVLSLNDVFPDRHRLRQRCPRTRSAPSILPRRAS